MTTDLLRPVFDRIHESLYIYTPEGSIKKKNVADPDTILFCAWGNSPKKNVIKYLDHYRELYPLARILVFLTSFGDLMLHHLERQVGPLSPAIKAICSAPEGSKTLVHVFSNGGAYKLREIAAVYKRTTGNVLPIHTLIFDSAPGQPDFFRSVTAFKTQLPRTVVLRYVGYVSIYLYLTFMFFIRMVTGKSPITLEVWEALNDTELIDVNANRLYIYSKTDALINWQNIILHAGGAKDKGYKVQIIEFTGSKHVAHVVVDKERYWNAIVAAWNGTEISKAKPATKTIVV